MKTPETLARETADALGTEPEQLTSVIIKFKKEIGELEKETASLKRQIK